LPKDARLRKSAEFRAVYEGGRRFDGRLVTAFVLATPLEQHRLGITASRKMSRLAVKRNRAKRLLREAFRLTGSELGGLRNRYDWVFNARRLMLEEKADAVVADLRRIVAQVGRSEQTAPCETGK
jgi:ribonuclease P protein component